MGESVLHNDRIVDQFSQQAEGYSRLTGTFRPDRSAALRALAAASRDDLVLDVCCGPGRLTLDLAAHVRKATGLDLTPAMLERARDAQVREGIANVEWVEGDAYALPFEDVAFSLVTCSAAFHHLERPRGVLGEMIRVCRPGGRIVVRDVSPDPEKADAYDQLEKLRDPSHTHALTGEEFRWLGVGLPVGEAQVSANMTPAMRLDAVLATSFPEACSVEELHARFHEDAISGENRLGFGAQMIDGKLHVSYRMATVVWTKRT